MLRAFALLVVPTLTAAQAPVTLGQPLGRSGEGFTAIVEAVPLPDRRVLITDSRERSIAVLDLQSGAVTRLGRRGAGPREYQSAYTILPRADGTFAVYDATLRRLTIVMPEGEIAGVEAFERPQLPGFSAPRGPDRDGWVYVDVRRLGANGLERVASVMRWNMATGAVDSVAAVMQYAEGQGGAGIVPMPRADAWSFLADGSVAVVAAEDYRVRWSGGARGTISGTPVPHVARRAGTAEREQWVEQLLSAPAAGAAMTGGSESGGEPTRHAVRDRLRRFNPDRFPSHVPIFRGGFTPASPRGHVWIKSDLESDASTTIYDVIDRAGERVGRVRIPGRARVVGFASEDGVYVVRTDDDDLEWLESHRYPAVNGG